MPPLGKGRVLPRSPGGFGPSPDDATLVRAIADQDSAQSQVAFGLLYARHVEAVRKVCANQLRRDPDSVEDLVQETFARLLFHAGGLHSPDRVLQWLRRTAKWACRDHRNLARHKREEATDTVADIMGDGDFAELLADADRAARLLSMLDGRQAAVLKAHYYDGLTVAEIARLMGITLGAAKTLLYRARNEGRRLLEAGKAMIPLPVVEWFHRVGEIIKTVPPSAAAAALVPLVTAGVLWAPPLGSPREVSGPGANGTARFSPAALDGPAGAPAPAEAADPLDQEAVPANTAATTSAPQGGAADTGTYVPPASPTRELDVPAVGHVETYQEPATPPDRHIVLAPDGPGEPVGLRNHDEPALYPAFDAACAAAVPSVAECRH